MKLTKPQAAALALIEDNPNRVEAISRFGRGTLRINGNVERTVAQLGLVEISDFTTQQTWKAAWMTEPVTSTVRYWKLTELGRRALRGTL